MVQHAEGRQQHRAEGQRGRTPIRRARRQHVRRTLRLRGRHRHLPGSEDRARHPVQGEAQARQPVQRVSRQDAGHDRRARPRDPRRDDPHHRQRARRQAQREVHHHRHQGHEQQRPRPRRPVGDLRGHVHHPRQPDRHPLHIQKRRRPQPQQGQRARRHRIRQGVQALLRQERIRRLGQRPVERARQGKHRPARQGQDHGQCQTRG